MLENITQIEIVTLGLVGVLALLVLAILVARFFGRSEVYFYLISSVVVVDVVGWAFARFSQTTSAALAVVTTIFSLMTLMLLKSILIDKVWVKFVIMPVVIAFYGFVVGLLMGNPIRYVLSDTVNVSLVVLISYLLFIGIKRFGLQSIGWLVATALILNSLVLLTFRMYTGERIGGPDLFPIIWVLFVPFPGLNNQKAITNIFFGIVTIAAAVLSASRRAFLSLGLTYVFYIGYFGVSYKGIKRAFFALLFVCLFFASVYETEYMQDTLHKIEHTYEDEKLDSSAAVRLYQSVMAVSYLLEHDKFYWILGVGNGAIYFCDSVDWLSDFASSSVRISILREEHNVHNTYAAIALRNGFLGIFLFLIWVVMIIGGLLKKRNLENSITRRCIYATAVFSIFQILITSNLIYTLADHVSWGYLIAAVAWYNKIPPRK